MIPGLISFNCSVPDIPFFQNSGAHVFFNDVRLWQPVDGISPALQVCADQVPSNTCSGWRAQNRVPCSLKKSPKGIRFREVSPRGGISHLMTSAPSFARKDGPAGSQYDRTGFQYLDTLQWSGSFVFVLQVIAPGHLSHICSPSSNSIPNLP